MSEFRGPTREKICLDHNKLRLGTACPTAEGKWSSLVWGIHKNNPRITVYTGDPADNTSRTNNGAIRAELDAGLEPQALLATTETVPEVEPNVTDTVVVPCPLLKVAPTGTFHAYEFALGTELIEKTTVSPAQTVTFPVIAPGCAGAPAGALGVMCTIPSPVCTAAVLDVLVKCSE